MTDEQYQRCLTCLYRKKHVFDKHKICNLRGKDLNFSGECPDYVHDPDAYIPEHPERFELYRLKKHSFFEPTCNNVADWITIGTFFLLFVVLLFFSSFAHYGTFLYLAVMVFFGILCFIRNFHKIEPLNADYIGDIVLQEDKIIIRGEEIPLDKIDNIHFYNADFEGAHIEGKPIFYTNRLSNGLNNSLSIRLKNGKLYKFNYLRKDYDNLLRLKNLLSYYYKKGLISRYDIKTIFGKKHLESLDKIDLY